MAKSKASKLKSPPLEVQIADLLKWESVRNLGVVLNVWYLAEIKEEENWARIGFDL